MVESAYHGHVVVDAPVLRRCFLEYPRFHSIAPLGNTTESDAGHGGERIEVPESKQRYTFIL